MAGTIAAIETRAVVETCEARVVARYAGPIGTRYLGYERMPRARLRRRMPASARGVSRRGARRG